MLSRERSEPRVRADRFPLSKAARRARVRVVRVARRSPRTTHRLAALGVVPGAELTVLRAHGPAIVALGGARVALGRSAAECVEVERAG